MEIILKEEKGRMVLCALNIFVKEIFKERDFPIADLVDTGLQALLELISVFDFFYDPGYDNLIRTNRN